MTPGIYGDDSEDTARHRELIEYLDDSKDNDQADEDRLDEYLRETGRK